MTTVAPEQTNTEAGVVDLTEQVPPAPKRRGRPPGSKNKPKTGARSARKTTAARTAPAAPRVPKTGEEHAVLVENTESGTRFTFFSESGQEMLSRTIPQQGWVLDRR